MLPLKLSFGGFESYLSTQTVDFTAFGKNGIFLICGRTGSGKTAILDAMTYALYGETSGGDRQQVRCVSAEGETFAELDFSQDGEIYRFRRALTPKKRAKDKLDSTAVCLKYSEEEGTFKPILERSTAKSVTKAAEDILGLTAEEFRRMTVLPQGKFEAFLTSNSAQKEEILTKIFGNSLYLNITEELVNRANAEKSAVKDALTMLSGILTGVDCENTEQLREKLEASEANAAAIAKQAAEYAKSAENAEKAYQTAVTNAENYAAFDSANAQLTELEKLRPEIDEANRRTAVHLKAAKASVAADAADISQKALIQRKQRISEAKNAALSAKAAYKEWSEKAKDLPEIEKSISEITFKLENAEKSRTILKQLSDAEAASVSAEKSLERSRTETEKAENESARLKSEFSADEAELDRLKSRFLTRQPIVAEEMKRIEQAERLISEIEEIRRERRDKSERAAALNKDISAAGEQHKAADEAYSSAQRKYYGNMAFCLAERLSEGDACPVCGSVHHPSPAAACEDDITAEMLKSLESDRDEKFRTFTRLTADLSGLNSEISSADEKLSRTEGELSQLNYSPENAENIRREQQELTDSQRQIAKLSENLAKLKTELNAADNHLSQLKEQTENAARESAAKKAQADTLRQSAADIPFSLTDADTVCKQLSEERRQLSDKKSGISSGLANAEKNLSAAEAALSAAEAELKAAEADSIDKQTRLERALSEQGFSTTEEMRAALIPEKEFAQLSEKVRAFAENYAVYADRAAQLKIALTGISRPDDGELFSLKTTLETEKSKLSEINDKKAAALSDTKKLADTLAKCTAMEEKFGERGKRAERLSEFAELIRGSRGISFNRYAMGVILALIVDEANRILLDSLGGKFQLAVRSDDSGSTKSGLDLTAITPTGSYPVQGLSGGEKFVISLALSRALSQAVCSRGGKDGTEAMFIDEGFGSLDGSELANAVGILRSMDGGQRLVGVISHVEAVREMISDRIYVEKTANGSLLKNVKCEK